MVSSGAKVKEVPFSFGNRTAGESKIIKNEMQETLRVIFLLQQRIFKFAVVGFVGYLVNASFAAFIWRRRIISLAIVNGTGNY